MRSYDNSSACRPTARCSRRAVTCAPIVLCKPACCKNTLRVQRCQYHTESPAPSLTSRGGTRPILPSMTKVRDMLYCVTTMVSRIPAHTPASQQGAICSTGVSGQ
jgi:hypothetical protein